MTPTLDVERFRILTGGDPRIEEIAVGMAKAGNLVALVSDGGAMAFIRTDKPFEWKVTLGFHPDARGAAAKDDINLGLTWMFANTDAVEIMGNIESENKACIALVPYTYGGQLTDYGEVKVYRTTIERWASAYGLKSAIEAMEAAGNGAKVDVLRKRSILP